MDNSPPHASEYVTPPPRSAYPLLTSPAAPIAPRVFNMAQDENGENESETRVETSQKFLKFRKVLIKFGEFWTIIENSKQNVENKIVKMRKWLTKFIRIF